VGSYHINLEDLNSIGVTAIRNAMSSDLVVVDEIAPMEFKSPEFIKAVEKILDSDMNMLVVLHQRSSHRIAERIRKEFDIYTVTLENRKNLVSEIADRINRAFS
jgi:nucleoside-triphosphatase